MTPSFQAPRGSYSSPIPSFLGVHWAAGGGQGQALGSGWVTPPLAEEKLPSLEFFQKTFMFWLKKMKFYDFKKYFS